MCMSVMDTKMKLECVIIKFACQNKLCGYIVYVFPTTHTHTAHAGLVYICALQRGPPLLYSFYIPYLGTVV